MAIVILYDINEPELVQWAKENCSSLICWTIYENDHAQWIVDDAWQQRFEFDFNDPKDALMFRLKWQQ